MRQLTTSLQNCHHGDYHLPIYLAHTISYYPTLRFADKWIWSPKKYYPNYSLVVYKCLKPIFFIFFPYVPFMFPISPWLFFWILAFWRPARPRYLARLSAAPQVPSTEAFPRACGLRRHLRQWPPRWVLQKRTEKCEENCGVSTMF